MTRLSNMITFMCPNGHRLSCPEQQAGKGGKCPKCGASFKIPLPQDAQSNPPPAGTVGDTQPYDFSGLNGPGSGGPGSGAASMGQAANLQGPAGGEPPATGSSPALQGEADKIEFLCPNGHKLFGKKANVGRGGQCPHCGARFIVPDPDEMSQLQIETPPPEPENIVINVDSGSKVGKDSKVGRDSAPKNPPLVEVSDDDLEQEEAIPEEQDEQVPEEAETSEEYLPPADGSTSVLAEFFDGVWSYKQDGATVEIHLADGKMFMPDFYAPSLSQRTHGVFAVREPNRTHTLTIVSWTSISRVVVRGLPDLPPDMV